MSWTSFMSDLHTWLRIISSVSDLSTDSLCGVWGLLCGGPHEEAFVCKFDTMRGIWFWFFVFILVFIHYPRYTCHFSSQMIFSEMAFILSTLYFHQSGTKPNLITICAWLQKLVATVSSQFQHLINTGFNVGFLVKWLPIMVAHTCKWDIIWVVYISRIGNGSIRL